MTPITVRVDQLVEWSGVAYVILHVMFGLVTHYHSVWQVRQHNKERPAAQIGPSKMFVLFAGRMTLGFPWFVISRLLSPIGNRWHWDAQQIYDRLWTND